MTAIGSTGRDSSAIVTGEFIREFELRAIIMVGIAFGRDSDKQKIGNVLVSDRVIPYEPQRIGNELEIDRGITISSTPLLLNRFRNTMGWNFAAPDGVASSFQIGAIVSGEKLIDNINFKKKLFDRYPTAIGGEMEGAGVASSAERLKCEWIIAKGICDWGDGEKDDSHQEFAAAAAIDLVSHVLNQIGALNGL